MTVQHKRLKQDLTMSEILVFTTIYMRQASLGALDYRNYGDKGLCQVRPTKNLKTSNYITVLYLLWVQSNRYYHCLHTDFMAIFILILF